MPAASGSGDGLQLKKTYKTTSKLEVFYTGGAARVSRDGKLLACTCNEDVKVSSRRRAAAATTATSSSSSGLEDAAVEDLYPDVPALGCVL